MSTIKNKSLPGADIFRSLKSGPAGATGSGAAVMGGGLGWQDALTLSPEERGGDGGSLSSLLQGIQGWSPESNQPLSGAAVAEQVAGLSKNANSAVGGSANGQGVGERKQLEQTFDHSINKLENAPKKAKAKMEPGTVENVRNKKEESLQAHDQASDAEARAQEATSEIDTGEIGGEGGEGGQFGGYSANSANSAKGGKNADPLAGKLKSLTAGSKGQGKVDESAMAFAQPPSSDVNEGSSMPELKNAMNGRIGYANSLDEGFQGLRGRHGAEAKRTDQQSKRVDGLEDIGTAYGAKENAHGAKEKAFKSAGDSMLKASQGLAQAAQIMGQVAGMLTQVAAAVAAIPFVGPALSAAIKKVATVVAIVGKGLGMLSQMLGQAGQKKQAEAAVEGQNKNYNKAKGLEAKIGEAQAKNTLDESKEKLAKHQEEDQDLAARRAENSAEMQRIADLIRNKGGNANVSGGEASLGGDPEGRAGDKNKLGGKPAGPQAGQGGPGQAGAQAAPAPGPTSSAKNAGGQAVAAAPRGGAGAKSGNGPAAAATPQPETKMAAARPTPNGSTGGQGQGNSGEGQRPNSPAKSDDKTKINDKKDEEKRPVEQRRADRADRLSKADKSRKGSASTGDDGAEGESQVSIEAGRQKAEEDQLRRLAESIKESRQGGGERAMERRGDQRQLGQLYNDTVTRKTPISAEVNALVREQMKDATERLQGQAQIAEDGGETMAKGIGGVGGPQAGNPFAKSPFAAAQGKVTPAKPLAQGGFQQGNPRGPEQAQAGPTRAYNDGQPANGNSSQARMRPAREVA